MAQGIGPLCIQLRLPSINLDGWLRRDVGAESVHTSSAYANFFRLVHAVVHACQDP